VPSATNAPATTAAASHYRRYIAYFANSEEARKHREAARTKLNIADDDTLDDVKQNKGTYVNQLYDAMIDVSKPLDNNTSDGYRRFVEAHHYKEEDIVAACWDVLVGHAIE